MKNLVAILLFFVSVTAHSQSIKGKVCFKADRSPVQFASVALLSLPDSSMITGVITLTDGGFLLEKVKPGQYFVRASFVGYTTNGKAVTVGEGTNVITVDTIFLAETTTSLGEVKVVGERLKGKEMVDRTVYSVPPTIAKASSNGYDILKKIPQVNVDFQNNITLNGSSNFIIQVDGRQRDREFLAKLQPSDIQSIEIISNPSGKYEGNIDGVINVILKKEARYGISGNVGGQIKPIGKMTTAVTGSIDYSVGKVTFYTTAYTFTQGLNITATNDNFYTMIDSTTRFMGDGNIKVSQSSVNSGFDYYINDRNSVSFNINYKPITQNVSMPGETYLYRANTPLDMVSSSSGNSLKSNEVSFSLFYRKTFEKPVEEFSSETNYYIFRSDTKDDFSNTRYKLNTDSVVNIYSRFENDLNRRNYVSTKLDFVYPLGMSAKFETGYQFYYQDMSYDFNIDYSGANNLFEYNELRNSLYAGFVFNLKKFGIQTVLRAENSHIEADSVTRPDYTCFLPSLNLQYKFSASHNLKFTYNRRINRPGIYQMNPYQKTSQSYAITRGNPDLRPDYRDRLQLTYTWNFGSNYFSPYVYDEFYSNKVGNRYILTTSPIDGTLTTISEPFNLLSGYELGGGLNAMLWYVNINARAYKGHINEFTGASVTIPSTDYFSYSITSYAFANLDKKKTATAILFLNYNGVNINAQSRTYSIPLYGVGLQKKLKDHNFGIFWLLPFTHTTRFQRTETETPLFNARNIVGIDISNFIQFSYSYTFNRGKNVKKMNRKVNVESDSKSQAIGGN